MIKLENISKAYKDITLFNGVNAEFESGSRIAIKGVNGSGIIGEKMLSAIL